MIKDICPKCGKLVWLTQPYMISDGQAWHVVCESHNESHREQPNPEQRENNRGQGCSPAKRED